MIQANELNSNKPSLIEKKCYKFDNKKLYFSLLCLIVIKDLQTGTLKR